MTLKLPQITLNRCQPSSLLNTKNLRLFSANQVPEFLFTKNGHAELAGAIQL